MEVVRYAGKVKTERFLKYGNNYIVRTEQQKSHMKVIRNVRVQN